MTALEIHTAITTNPHRVSRLVPQLGLDPEGLEVGTIDPAGAVSKQTMLLRRFFGRYIGG